MDVSIQYVILYILEIVSMSHSSINEASCVDLDNDCAEYGHEYICTWTYEVWSIVHCRKYCDLCKVQTSTASTERTTSTTTSTTPRIETTDQNLCPDKVQNISDPQTLFQHGYKCYEVVTTSNESWTHARNDCHEKGGTLLAIEDDEEQAFVYNTLTRTNISHLIWLGLNDRTNEEQWQWDAGAPVHYVNWVPGRYVDQYHEQDDCGVMDMSRQGQWDDVDCNAVTSDGFLSYPWICQYTKEENGTTATWSNWFYGSCSVTCGSGTTHRVRRCHTDHSSDCVGTEFEAVSCDTGPCPIDGNWGLWESWSTCSTTCANGTQSRSRSCDSPSPMYGGGNCTESKTETTVCYLKECPPTWSSWFYGPCSVTCGPGTFTRLRRCNTGCEDDCTGKAFEIVPCDPGACPIDGSWSSWLPWSKCTSTCGNGTFYRTRLCDNPAPKHNGSDCGGPRNETSTCKLKECPHWLQFYEASSCSVTCGTGYIQLKRNCSSGNPLDCHGSEYSETSCNPSNCQ